MMIIRCLSLSCLLVLILVSCFGSSYFSDDPDVTALIKAIQEYQKAEGYPPEKLDDLIPSYLPKINRPATVTEIVYDISDIDKSWTLEFRFSSGDSSLFDSELNLWTYTLPHP